MKSMIQSLSKAKISIGLVIVLQSLLIAQSSQSELQGSILHITGYAHTGFVYDKTGAGSFTIGSFSPIFHFLYQELILMETELEIEAEEDGSTAINLEYLTLDLFLNDYATLVIGKYFSPIGQFKQNLHPSWINKLPSAPIGFGHGGIVPAADIGVQLRGGLPISKAKLVYAISIENGPQYVEGEDHHDEGLGVVLAHRGFIEDDNSAKVISGRVSLLPKPNYNIAVSASNGSVVSPDGVGVDYSVIGFDSFWRPAFQKRLELRSEYVNKIVGEEKYSAWYAQGACLLPLNFEGVLRYGKMDNDGDVSTQTAVGLNYLFSNNVIAKLAYEIYDSDDFVDQLLVQLAFGF